MILKKHCINQPVVTTNVTTTTGRKEGVKEGRRKNEKGVSQPGIEPGIYDFTRMWITTRPMADVRRGALFAALPTAVLAMAIGTGPWPLGFGLGGAAPFAGWFVFNLCLI